jgi:hypothetical protein
MPLPADHAARRRDDRLALARRLTLWVASGAAAASLALGTAFAHALPGHRASTTAAQPAGAPQGAPSRRARSRRAPSRPPVSRRAASRRAPLLPHHSRPRPPTRLPFPLHCRRRPRPEDHDRGAEPALVCHEGHRRGGPRAAHRHGRARGRGHRSWRWAGRAGRCWSGWTAGSARSPGAAPAAIRMARSGWPPPRWPRSRPTLRPMRATGRVPRRCAARPAEESSRFRARGKKESGIDQQAAP